MTSVPTRCTSVSLLHLFISTSLVHVDSAVVSSYRGTTSVLKVYFAFLFIRFWKLALSSTPLWVLTMMLLLIFIKMPTAATLFDRAAPFVAWSGLLFLELLEYVLQVHGYLWLLFGVFFFPVGATWFTQFGGWHWGLVLLLKLIRWSRELMGKSLSRLLLRGYLVRGRLAVTSSQSSGVQVLLLLLHVRRKTCKGLKVGLLTRNLDWWKTCKNKPFII